MRRIRLFVAVVALCAVAGCSDSASGESANFDALTVGQRVYDQTGDSLSAADAADLQRRLDGLQRDTGADLIAYVRELDADSDDTLDQVEQLQQQWVATAGVDQDTAGAILINREPGADDEARAGIFLGSTYDDGNVPRDEQEAIVEDSLIPPLRDGNVSGSLNAGIDRLTSSIRNGPPVTALNRFADGPGSTWLPWTGLVISLFGLFGTMLVFRRRATPTVSKQPPTTVRPDHTTDPALATALVHRSAQASGVPAAVLALAADDALSIEQEKEPGKFGKGTVQVRLLDHSRARGDVQHAVWNMLSERSEKGVVSSSGLQKIARVPGTTKDIIDNRLRTNGWLAEGTARPRVGLVALAVLGGALAVGGFVVVAAGALLMLLTAIPASILFVGGLVAAIAYSKFSVAGLDAARPWEAYRDGLKQAGKAQDESVDLDAALPDIVALGLASMFDKRLKAATDPDSATPLRAFSSSATTSGMLPWAAFSGVFVSSSGGGTVSSAGAGGGGGAAGST